MSIDDQASDRELMDTALAIKQRKPVPENTGLCLNCGEASSGAFCSFECGEDWERRRKFNLGAE